MAIDILSIPAMSAEVERVFSGAKITMGVSTIEAVGCLKSWFRLDLFAQEDLNEMMEVDLDLGE